MNKETTTMYIVRHGESEANIRSVVSGSSDHEITQMGKQQALELGKKFRNVPFDSVFSSDLKRARITAELITLGKNLTIETTKALRERDFGELEGKPTSELHAILNSWKNLPSEEQLRQRPAKNAETGEESAIRFVACLSEITTKHRGETILIATHGSLMYSFLNHVGFAPINNIRKVNNTAWIITETNGIDFKVKEMEGVVIEHESKSINN